MADIARIYWDSCMWLGLINQEPDKVPACEHLIASAKAGEIEIWTSAFTLAEVHKRLCEGDTKELSESDDVVFEEYLDQDHVFLAELDKDVGTLARRLLRGHAGLGKAPDAIHLATAVLNNLDELHTYDPELLRLDEVVVKEDGEKLKICRPPEPPVVRELGLFDNVDRGQSEDEKPATEETQ